jgi:serpin B
VGAIHESRSHLPRNPESATSAEQLADLVTADRRFAFDLYRQLATEAGGSIFVSPYSISTALSMLLAGARGSTAAELEAALGVGDDQEVWHTARNRLELELAALSRQSLAGNPDATPLTLEPTNGFFGQTGYPFKQPYLDTLAANYGAGAHSLDFAHDSEDSRKAINDWVAERTRDRIPDLLPEGFIDSNTVAVLVNAIFFKANWLYTFQPEHTDERDFHLPDGSTASVPMMHGDHKWQYASGGGWQAIELPYVGGAEMLVIVPDEGEFAGVEAALGDVLLAEIDAGMSEHQVDLGLPRWESESEFDLIPPLQSLGIEKVFRDADLTGIADAALSVSGVQHVANITVDEIGTEAAAATAVPVLQSPAEPVTLIVDRPFIYLIRDTANGEILFLGRYLGPE